jgi:hypothetical protein
MASIADIFFTAALDDARLQVDAKRAGDKAGATMGNSLAASIKKSWSGGEIGKGLVQGLGLAGGLGAARLLSEGLSVVTNVIEGSIEAASNLNETVSKGRVIFGANAAAVEKWADTAATSFGQSKRAALDVASTFAGLFSTVGLSLDDATDKAKALTQLGSDLASFFNTDVATATAALRSGLAGESEPLRQFNVFLSETAVAAKAAELGMKKVNGQFTEGQKVTARYAIIMDQTGAAQGDFARTSDGLANSQRTLSAEWEDASAKLGQALLPIVTDFVKFLANDGIPAVLGFVNAVGQLVNVIGQLTTADPTSGIDKFFDDLAHAPYKAGLAVRGTIEDLVQTEMDLISGTKRASAAVADSSTDIAEATRGMAVTVKEASTEIAEHLRSTAQTVKVETLKVFGAFGSDLAAQSDYAQAYARRAGNLLGDAIAQGVRETRDTVNSAWADLLDGLKNRVGRTQEFARDLGRLLSTRLANGMKSSDPYVKHQAEYTKQLIIDRLEQLAAGGTRIGKKGMAALAKAMKSKDPDIREAARLILASASKVAPSKSKATEWGKAIGQGLINGMNAMAAQVGIAAGNLANVIAAYLKTHSPAKLGPLSTLGGPEGWGKAIADYISKGLRENLPDLSTALGTGLNLPTLGHAVPAMGSTPAYSGFGGASAPVVTSGNVYNISANVTGLIKAKSPLDIARELGRFARNGQFTPKAEPA